MDKVLVSRRVALSAGGTLATGILLGAIAPATAAEGTLITKSIPATGERIPVIGLGTNQFSVETPEEKAALQQVLEEMSRRGGKVVDTARAYGRSEEVLGELIESMRNRGSLFISTKTPMRADLSAPDLEVQKSFDNLRVKVIDLMLVHNLFGLQELMPALIRAKEAGRIRYIGMSTSSDEQYEMLMDGMRRYPLDFIQIDYSVGNRSAAEKVLPLARERKLAVLINSPFGGRRQAATTTFGKVSGKTMPDWAAEFDAASWAQLFLKYVVSHPAVTAAIPGTTRVAHIIDNQGAGRGRLPDAAMRQRIEQYWDTL